MNVMRTKRTFNLHTFGCKVNRFDSGHLHEQLSQAGYLHEPSPKAQVHILNTCAVTQTASKEAVKRVRQIKAKNPFCTTVLTGCSAQVDTDLFSPLKAVDLIVANSHKPRLVQILHDYFANKVTDRVFKSNIFKENFLQNKGKNPPHETRAFVKIQDGCNSFCTFCIIPFARGKSRSLSISSLVRKVQNLYENSIQEVVLTGVHIGDYKDPHTGQSLARLVQSLLEYTDMPRIRLSSLEPIEVSKRLLKLFSNPRMCPHFHMSIQSVNTTVLKQMKRKYGKEEVLECLQALRSYVPGAFIGMDVIAGFPSESDFQFEDTYESLSRSSWTRLHVFPYSERKGTWASLKIPDTVSEPVRRERAKRLRLLSQERHEQEALQQIGQKKQVLFYKNRDFQDFLKVGMLSAKGFIKGLSRDYWPVRLFPVSTESLSLHPRSSPFAQALSGEVTLEVQDVLKDSSMKPYLAGKFVLPS